MWPFSKKGRDHSVGTSHQQWRLKCRYCGEVYIIGDDAFFVTEDDIDKAVAERGGHIIEWAGRSRGTDLVMRWDDPKHPKIDAGMRERERKTAARIRAAMANGESCVWYCEKCRDETKTNKYPANWGREQRSKRQ